MKNLLGLVTENPIISAASLLVFLVLLASTYFYGRSDGKTIERSEWLQKEAIEDKQALENTKRLYDIARAKESLASVELNNIQDKLQGAIDELENQKSVINQQYASIVQLRYTSQTLQTNRSENSPISASTRECNGETITELSAGVFEFVYRQFEKCDKIVEQLSSCQEVIETDRKIFNN